MPPAEMFPSYVFQLQQVVLLTKKSKHHFTAITCGDEATRLVTKAAARAAPAAVTEGASASLRACRSTESIWACGVVVLAVVVVAVVVVVVDMVVVMMVVVVAEAVVVKEWQWWRWWRLWR